MNAPVIGRIARILLAVVATLAVAACNPGSTPGPASSTNPGAAPSAAPSSGGIGY